MIMMKIESLFIETRRNTPNFSYGDIRRNSYLTHSKFRSKIKKRAKTKLTTVGHTGSHAFGERVRPKT